ncbi:unnamed protein product [Prorocentrum cordatum]|uniref:Pentraxin n=1 Tax=Prorocentrum cordatum TaxID=2364126 RepID=A0ABN9R521_9DINO|nr:unnamed protein product [Polarella glacialis]
MLCTASPSGHMRVFKDGALVGENAEGMAPLRQDRPRMILGGHYLYADQEFNGSLSDVKLWNQEVAWPTPPVDECEEDVATAPSEACKVASRSGPEGTPARPL